MGTSRNFSKGEEAAASNEVVMGVFHWTNVADRHFCDSSRFSVCDGVEIASGPEPHCDGLGPMKYPLEVGIGQYVPNNLPYSARYSTFSRNAVNSATEKVL